MKKLTEREYNLALAILVKYMAEEELFGRVEKITKLNLFESIFNNSTNELYETLLDFLEVPQDETLEKKNGYCRDWVSNIHMDLMDLKKPVKEKAKILLDKIIEGNT
jgi:hypothetical protein